MLSPEQVKAKRDLAEYWYNYWTKAQNYAVAEIHRKEMVLYDEILEVTHEL